MLSIPGQRHISAPFFLSHCLSLSALQPGEEVVSLGSAPPLPSVLPQAYLGSKRAIFSFPPPGRLLQSWLHIHVT